MKPKVILVDDHNILTEGLKALLASEFEIVAVASNGRAAIKAVRNLNPAVVVLDISMPLLNGIDAAREIRHVSPKIKIVFLTMHRELTYVREAFAAGACGYVIKQSLGVDLHLAIRQALLGKTYITPGVVKEGVDVLPREHQRQSSLQLTLRQREVLQLVAEGRSAKEAATALNLSPRTVEFHKYRILERLGLQTTAELTQFAIKHKIISG